MTRKWADGTLICFSLFFLMSCASVISQKIQFFHGVPDREYEELGLIRSTSCQGFDSSAKKANEVDAFDLLRKEAAEAGADAVIKYKCYPPRNIHKDRQIPGGCVKEAICLGMAVKFIDSEKE